MLTLLSKLLGGIFSLKTLVFTLVTAVLGIVLYNLMCEVVQELMEFAVSQISGESFTNPLNPTFSGFVGWSFAQLKIPECVSVVVSCVSIKFVLRKIPFLRW